MWSRLVLKVGLFAFLRVFVGDGNGTAVCRKLTVFMNSFMAGSASSVYDKSRVVGESTEA